MGFSDELRATMDKAVADNELVLQVWRGGGSLEVHDDRLLLEILVKSSHGIAAGLDAIAGKIEQLEASIAGRQSDA
jgi:hypothetical protein